MIGFGPKKFSFFSFPLPAPRQRKKGKCPMKKERRPIPHLMGKSKFAAISAQLPFEEQIIEDENLNFKGEKRKGQKEKKRKE